MRDPSVFRTLAVPIGIAVVFLVFTPKLCERAVVRAKRNQPAPAATVPGEPPPSGLIISSPSPAAARRGPLQFPPGLDAARIQYLVEIDQTFATPKMMTVVEDAPVTKALLDRQYVEKLSDGTYGPTREGLINVNGAVNSPKGWVVPVAQRKFVSVDTLEDRSEGRYHAVVRWQWEPKGVGANLLRRGEDHLLTAEVAGGQGHWVLTRFIQGPDQEFR